MRNQTVINLSSKSDQFKKASLQIGERRQMPLLTDTRQRNAIEGLPQGFSRRACRRLFGQPFSQAPAIFSLRLANSRRALYSIKPHTLSPISSTRTRPVRRPGGVR